MHRYDQGSVPSPAVGHDFSDIPNYADSYRLLTVRATLTTSAVVANRWPHFQFVSPSGNVLHEIVPQAAQAASLAVHYNLVAESGAANEGSTANDGVASLSLPNLWWPNGTKLNVATTALDAGDQWSLIYYSALIGDQWEHERRLLELLAQIGG